MAFKAEPELDLDRAQTPQAWITLILNNCRNLSGGIVEQHIVGAKLVRRFGQDLPNYPADAGDMQTDRAGDFSMAKSVFHVTASPAPNVLQKCADNLRIGLRPILLVPADQKNKAEVYAQDLALNKSVLIFSIEDFISLNIMELAAEENKDYFTVLKEIVQIYNRRLSEVETDLSLQIEVH